MRTGALSKFQSTSAGTPSHPAEIPVVCKEPLGLCPAEINNMEMLWLGCLIPDNKTCGLSAPAETKQRNLDQMDGEREASSHGRLPRRFGSQPGHSAPWPQPENPLRRPHLPPGDWLCGESWSGEEGTTPLVA